MLKIDQIKEYVEFLKNTDIVEIEIETDSGEKLHLKRDENLVGKQVLSNLNQLQTDQKTVLQTIQQPTAQQEKSFPQEYVVKSPVVGKFLTSTTKDHPPFVVEGTKVKQGQKLALIETMRIFRDVLSPVDGIVKKVLVEDGQYVEYGQKLFILELEETTK